MTRRAELAQIRDATQNAAAADAPATFLGRMKKFLGLTVRSALSYQLSGSARSRSQPSD